MGHVRRELVHHQELRVACSMQQEAWVLGLITARKCILSTIFISLEMSSAVKLSDETTPLSVCNQGRL